MAEMFQPEDVRIDNESQLMLHALRGGEWVRALKLRRAANLDENRQVFYRMEKHLIPGGLVEEQQRENSGEMRMFRLTSRGAEWVEERARELEMPTTHEQIQNYALEGYEAGTSAKESVQTYRKKLHRLKRRVERAEEDVEEVEDDQRESNKDIEYLRERSQAIRMRSIGNNNRLDSLEEDVEERATIDRVDGVSDDVSGVERRLMTVEDKQVGLAREQAEAARTRALVGWLAKPAGYVAGGALVVYLSVLIAVLVLAQGLLASVLVGGATGVLGVAVGIGGMVYMRGTGVLP
jgi:DNA-binding PadR family transcriptional regulator